jgi:hypothetical protein
VDLYDFAEYFFLHQKNQKNSLTNKPSHTKISKKSKKTIDLRACFMFKTIEEVKDFILIGLIS